MLNVPPQPIKRLHGDPRWSRISNLASWSPLVVISLTFICIIQIALGAVWISKIGGELSFALVLQPLVLPCLSLFNTVPSLHLHLYSRTNNPKLAVWFSGIMCVLYFVAAILDLAVCSGSGVGALKAECASSSSAGDSSGPDISENFWDACIALWLISAVGYGLNVYMAAIVWIRMRRSDNEAKARGERPVDVEIQMLGPEEIERRNKEAAERWRRIQDL